MRYLILSFLSVFTLAACNGEGKVTVADAYMFATPATMPTAAVFMTVENSTSENDQLVDFKITDVDRTELHVMEMNNDVMKMRRVDRFDIPADDKFVLEPMGAHIMVFDFNNDFVDGQTVQATAIFEKAGEIAVKINVKNRAEQHSGHNH